MEMQNEPGPARDRGPVLYAFIFSVLVHLMAFTVLRQLLPPLNPRETPRSTRLEVALQPGRAAAERPEAESPESEQSEPDPSEPDTEPVVTEEATPEARERPPKKASQPAEPAREQSLDLDSVLRDTVQQLQEKDENFRFEGDDPSVGGSAFDPRMRERIKQSEDINTPPPPKKHRVRSYQEPNGDVYVEVGDGSCFRVKESWEAGAPRHWEMVRCKGNRDRLELDPKPYLQIERD